MHGVVLLNCPFRILPPSWQMSLFFNRLVKNNVVSGVRIFFFFFAHCKHVSQAIDCHCPLLCGHASAHADELIRWLNVPRLTKTIMSEQRRSDIELIAQCRDASARVSVLPVMQ